MFVYIIEMIYCTVYIEFLLYIIELYRIGRKENSIRGDIMYCLYTYIIYNFFYILSNCKLCNRERTNEGESIRGILCLFTLLR